MVESLLKRALGLDPNPNKPLRPGIAQELLTAVSQRLIGRYPHLTARQLDVRIWEYERMRAHQH